MNTRTITDDAQAYINGKSGFGRPNSRRIVHLQWLGVYRDVDGRAFDAWSATEGLGSGTYVRLEPFDGRRTQYQYDPGHALADQIRKDNTV